MIVEIYIDSLFLVNFVMNLYLLLLVNRSLYRTATRLRLCLGAAVGAVFFLFPFLMGGAVWLKIAVSMLTGTGIMIFIAFPINSVKAFFQIAEKLLISAFLLGGGMLFLIKRFPVLGAYMQNIFGVIGIGALLFMLISWFQERKSEKSNICRVILTGNDGKMKIAALLDSGNSLIEPISGKPVSVVEKSVFYGLWKEPPELYRAIPYHSIGKQKGILKGYLLPEIQIEMDGICKTCKEVYIAVSEESITGEAIESKEINSKETCVKMIVNPVLLKC